MLRTLIKKQIIFCCLFLVILVLNNLARAGSFSAILGSDGIVNVSGSESFECTPEGELGSAAFVHFWGGTTIVPSSTNTVSFSNITYNLSCWNPGDYTFSVDYIGGRQYSGGCTMVSYPGMSDTVSLPEGREIAIDIVKQPEPDCEHSIENIVISYHFTYSTESCYDPDTGVDRCRRLVDVFVGTQYFLYNDLPISGQIIIPYDFSRISAPITIDAGACCAGHCNRVQKIVYPYECEDKDNDGSYAISASCPRGDDCDDNDPTVNPCAEEVCDGKDNNCDGLIDETCYGDECGPKSNNTDIGSSASLSSGNLYHGQQVLSSHGLGLTANITLSYNSLDTTVSPLGRGWVHNYGTNITANGSMLVFKEQDGRRVYFSSSDGVTYSANASSGSHSIITKNSDGSYILTELSGVIHRFDSTGRLINITDRNNNVTTLTYTGNDLTSITDSSGRVTTLNYTNHRITSIIDPAGRTNTFTYNGDFLNTVTDPSGGTWTYVYGANEKMHTKTDPLGHTTTYSYIDTYDDNGNIILSKLISSQDPAENIKTITYNQTGKTAYVTEKNGTNWTYVYDNSLNVPLQITDPDANQTTYQYDSNRNLLSETKGGITTTYTYDTDGDMLTKTEAYGTIDERTTDFTYNGFGQILTETVDGITTKYTYDDNGNILTKTEAFSTSYEITTRYTYYGAENYHKLQTVTDPNSNLTEYIYSYDTSGHTKTERKYLDVNTAMTTTYRYDIIGNLLSTTDPNGNTTTYQYDLRDRLISQTNSDSGVINYEYDLAGNRTAITDANGNRTTFTYNSMNRLIKTTDPQGNSTNYTYDSEGNMTSMTIKDSANNVTTSESYTYDIYNRLTRTTHADSTFTEQTYDAVGNIHTKKDENGNVTTFAYDALKRLTSVTDQNQGVTSYTYDKRNNLTSVTDANTNVATYVYDSINRFISTISPDTGTTTYSYDPNGNMTSKTDANGVTTTYVYDVLNRQTSIQFPDSTQNINYYYDDAQRQNAKGRLTSMTDPSGTTWYDYDKMGRVVMETKQVNNLFYRTEYSYDLNGNLLSIIYPGGRKISYTYNQLNKVISVTDTYLGVVRALASNIGYLPFGNTNSVTYGNGLQRNTGYDNRYRIYSITTGGVQNLSYNYFDNSNISGITDNLNPLKNKTYSYDVLNRLATANGLWGNLSYSYDSVGNRTYETTGTGSTTYTYTTNTNKLASTSGEKVFSFNFDNNGNTTGENTRQYIYNQNQRLIKVMNGSAELAEYIYNGKGQRSEKWIPSENKCTIFHYDQNGMLIAESTSNGNIKTEYVYLNSQPLAKIEGNNIYYYHNDHLGTPMLMTDSASSVVWQGEFKPFGEPLSVTGSITNNLRFPGQYYDSETGLHQNYFRDYEPNIGRYVEADPILQPMVNLNTKGSKCTKKKITWRVPSFISKPQNLYPYVYVTGNPLTKIDRKGLACGSWWNDWLVPDKWPTYDFTGCCQDHDDCYGCKGKMEGKSKSDCDKTFCDCMLNVCENQDGDAKISCEGNAKTYCNAVQGKFGNDAFNNGRKCCNRGSSGGW